MADELIGFILHLPDYEYRRIANNWACELPEDYVIPIDRVMKCRYVAFAVDGRWKSIARIGAWHVRLGQGIHTAELSSLSSSVSPLVEEISNPAGNRWLNNYQKAAVESALNDERVIKRPDTIPPSLDMEEAAKAIARCYGVDAEQIDITINRKGRSEPEQSSAHIATPRN